jgi:uncharacterized phage protein (TIGR02218 family)
MALSLSATIQSIIASATSKPVEIHDIYLGSQTAEDSNTLHYVNYYRDINFFQYISGAAQTYSALGLLHTAIPKSLDGQISRVGYKLDNVNKAMGAFAAEQDFRNKRIVTRLIFRDHLTDASDAKVIFDGLIQSVSFAKSSMEASCVPVISSLSFETGWPYQINCNAKFGDVFCKVNRESADNKFSGIIESATVGTLTDSNLTQSDDYWNHGYVIFNSGTNEGYKRQIIDFSASTDTLTFSYALPTAPSAGDTYTVYRGCDKTLTMCQTIYNNEINYHGFHAIPLESDVKA